MHVLILGAGALGSLLGARLSRADFKLTLLTTNREHIRAIVEGGLRIEELDGGLERFRFASAVSDPADIGEAVDVVLVTVKTYDTQAAVSSVRNHCHASTIFLTLQNGIGNGDRIAELVVPASVLMGTTAQGATYLEPGRIRHGGNGPTFIGESSGPPSERVHSLVDLFVRARLVAEASSNMEMLIWKKLLVNVGINAITALTGIRNGGIADLEAARDLSRGAVEEAMVVAQAKGVPVAIDMVEQVLTVARATAKNRSSMGQDVDFGQRTEIDAINGAIVSFGQELGIATPVNRTLTQLIRIVEERQSG
ncbi:MAG TPA: 2-dehydropantoate 2-reductase [Syntrophobacteraceae bacterium]|nr:2-dehydropantoate 2-reductase [Syntrophobacteraceae bacterium]HBD09211.1 2-dehydropantoate 2-reductase [Syntrophobacteraceae bacterium]